MAEYIDRDGLINDLKDLPEQERIEYMGIYDCIKSTTAADVVEVECGEWTYGEFDIPHCSQCGYEITPNMISPYCPNCGARMDGGNNNA